MVKFNYKNGHKNCYADFVFHQVIKKIMFVNIPSSLKEKCYMTCDYYFIKVNRIMNNVFVKNYNNRYYVYIFGKNISERNKVLQRKWGSYDWLIKSEEYAGKCFLRMRKDYTSAATHPCVKHTWLVLFNKNQSFIPTLFYCLALFPMKVRVILKSYVLTVEDDTNCVTFSGFRLYSNPQL